MVGVVVGLGSLLSLLFPVGAVGVGAAFGPADESSQRHALQGGGFAASAVLLRVGSDPGGDGSVVGVVVGLGSLLSLLLAPGAGGVGTAFGPADELVWAVRARWRGALCVNLL